MNFSKAILFVASGAVAGCAGAAPNPVPIVQVQDRYMDCNAIYVEVQANNEKVQQLAKDEGWKVAQNVAAGVAGLVVWPLWFAMDFQGSASKEAHALQARQQYLATLAEQKQCAMGGPPPPPPPASRKM